MMILPSKIILGVFRPKLANKMQESPGHNVLIALTQYTLF